MVDCIRNGFCIFVITRIKHEFTKKGNTRYLLKHLVIRTQMNLVNVCCICDTGFPQNNYELLAKKAIEFLNNKEKIKKIGLCGRQHITEVAEYNIEKEWRTFFDTIPGQKPDMFFKQDPTSVVLKYLTLFQHMGKQKVKPI